MRWLAMVTLVVGGSACGKVIFGGGELFIWNGGDERVDVVVDGRSSATFDIPAHRGERVEDAVAGTYRVIERKGGKEQVYNFALKDGSSTVVNLDANSCFVRTDISGMYQAGKERVRLLQSYEKNEVVSFELLLPIMPGEPLPAARPKSTYAFQRLSDVPCNLLRNEAEMADYVRKSH